MGWELKRGWWCLGAIAEGFSQGEAAAGVCVTYVCLPVEKSLKTSESCEGLEEEISRSIKCQICCSWESRKRFTIEAGAILVPERVVLIYQQGCSFMVSTKPCYPHQIPF